MRSKQAVPIGDVNGDGIVDFAFGEPNAAPLVRTNAGCVYVVFGGQTNLAALDAANGTTDGVIQLSRLLPQNGGDGSHGFVIYGPPGAPLLGGGTSGSDLGGTIAAVGNVLGHSDGCNDFLVSAYTSYRLIGKDPKNPLSYQQATGKAFLIKGRTSWPAVFDTGAFAPTDGYVIQGVYTMGYLGNVSSAGDVNGDGIADILVSDRTSAKVSLGEAFLLFGGPSNLQALDAADDKVDGIIDPTKVNGTTGYVLTGTTQDIPGLNSIGNFNGDSYSDLLFFDDGASPGGKSGAGAGYVVFGGTANLSALDRLDGKQDGKILLSNLDGTHGFTIAGHNPGDALSVNGGGTSTPTRGGRMAGDLNGDGLNDVSVSEDMVSPNGISGAGEAFVVFGSSQTFPANFDVATLNGTNGFAITGANAGDMLGSDTDMAGDVNHDGVSDLVLGAWKSSPNGISGAGTAYVIYGHRGSFPPSMSVSSLDGSNGFVMNGINAGDHTGNMAAAVGDANGDGYSDLLISAVYASPNGVYHSGQFYLVYGGQSGPGTAPSLKAASARVIPNDQTSRAGVLAPHVAPWSSRSGSSTRPSRRCSPP